MTKKINLSEFLSTAEKSSNYANFLKTHGYGPYASHKHRLTKNITGKTLPDQSLKFIENFRKSGLIRTVFPDKIKDQYISLFINELLDNIKNENISPLENLISKQYIHISHKEPNSIVLFETALYKLAETAISPALISLPIKTAIEKSYYAAKKFKEIIRSNRKKIRRMGIYPLNLADICILPVIGPVWDNLSLEILSSIINQLGLPIGIFILLFRLVADYALKKSLEDYLLDKKLLELEDIPLIEEKIQRFKGELPIKIFKRTEKLLNKNSLTIPEKFNSYLNKKKVLLIDVLESFEYIFDLYSLPPSDLLTIVSDELNNYYKLLNKSKKKTRYLDEELTTLRNLHLGGKKYTADAQGAIDSMRAVLVGVFEPIRSAKALLDLIKIWPDEEKSIEEFDKFDISHHASLILIENNNFYRFGLKGSVIIDIYNKEEQYNKINSIIEEYNIMLTLIFGEINTSSQDEIEGFKQILNEISDVVLKNDLEIIPYGSMTFITISGKCPNVAEKIGKILEELIPNNSSPIPGISIVAAPKSYGLLCETTTNNLKIIAGETTKRAIALAKLSWSAGRVLGDLGSILSLIKCSKKFRILSQKESTLPELDIYDLLAYIIVRSKEPHNLQLFSPNLLIQLFGVINNSRQISAVNDYIGDISIINGSKIEGPVFSITKLENN